ncbi:PREDICTED: rab11 family-interacting protein 4-like [Myotis brandtii]|uniref:rab11 family-interacting protein 4-like n=1 Tax=Myotis brandtii TaxID=109478 RepID=UPI0003BBA408|nr:PREDICTED: rab11 family-interacting protein 4-like [Myotis brandtii]
MGSFHDTHLRGGYWWESGDSGCRQVGSGCFRELIVPSSSSQENHKLRDQNDDLNGQILSLSLYEAKNLFATQTKAQSLASEIDTASRDELMEALKEQEEINFRLRQYMDKIILAILDHNPSILEIKH